MREGEDPARNTSKQAATAEKMSNRDNKTATIKKHSHEWTTHTHNTYTHTHMTEVAGDLLGRFGLWSFELFP